MVEYAMCDSFLFCDDSDKPGRYILHPEWSNGDDKVGSNFSWACEELSFANLEREWGDSAVQEYIGHKVLVRWKRENVDIPQKTVFLDHNSRDHDRRQFEINQRFACLSCAAKQRTTKTKHPEILWTQVWI